MMISLERVHKLEISTFNKSTVWNSLDLYFANFYFQIIHCFLTLQANIQSTEIAILKKVFLILVRT